MSGVTSPPGMSRNPPVPAAESGLASLRPGFCFTPAQDRLFALGWPHMRFLDDVADFNFARPTLACLTRPDPTPQLRWSRSAATALVRTLGLPEVLELGVSSRALRAEAVREALNDDPVSRAEVRQFLGRRMMLPLPGSSERLIETFVLLAEQLVGSETCAELIVELLEEMDDGVLEATWALPPVVTYTLGFVLLRVPAPTATMFRERLARVFAPYDQLISGRRAAWSGALSHLRALDLVLHGGLAAERSTDRTLRWYLHAGDQPDLILNRVASDLLGFWPDARLAFLAGDDVLKRFGAQLKRMHDPQDVGYFLEQLAPVRSERVLRIMLIAATEGLRQEDALLWFRAHRAWATPMLDSIEASGVGIPAVRATTLKARLAKA